MSSRCGFIALIGAPNVGKSTLLNRVIGVQLSIVTPKSHTTRRRLLGITLKGESQILFVDTPGITPPQNVTLQSATPPQGGASRDSAYRGTASPGRASRGYASPGQLERAMTNLAWSEAGAADLIVLLTDARALNERNAQRTRQIIEELSARKLLSILAINKIDLIRREQLLSLSYELNRLGQFSHTFMISARSGDGVESLTKILAATLPLGAWLYPEDQLTDLPERMLAADVTREKLFLQLRGELPYASSVETEQWQECSNGSVKILQVIFVERAGQKAIVLGAGGSRIKSIGQASRQDLESRLGRSVHLKLFVKVRPHWLRDPERYRQLGLEPAKLEPAKPAKATVSTAPASAAAAVGTSKTR